MRTSLLDCQARPGLPDRSDTLLPDRKKGGAQKGRAEQADTAPVQQQCSGLQMVLEIQRPRHVCTGSACNVEPSQSGIFLANKLQVQLLPQFRTSFIMVFEMKTNAHTQRQRRWHPAALPALRQVRDRAGTGFSSEHDEVRGRVARDRQLTVPRVVGSTLSFMPFCHWSGVSASSMSF